MQNMVSGLKQRREKRKGDLLMPWVSYEDKRTALQRISSARHYRPSQGTKLPLSALKQTATYHALEYSHVETSPRTNSVIKAVHHSQSFFPNKLIKPVVSNVGASLLLIFNSVDASQTRPIPLFFCFFLSASPSDDSRLDSRPPALLKKGGARDFSF